MQLVMGKELEVECQPLFLFLLGVTSAVIEGDKEHFGNCGDESVCLT